LRTVRRPRSVRGALSGDTAAWPSSFIVDSPRAKTEPTFN
jgi:hypothetical protein